MKFSIYKMFNIVLGRVINESCGYYYCLCEAVGVFHHPPILPALCAGVFFGTILLSVHRRPYSLDGGYWSVLKGISANGVVWRSSKAQGIGGHAFARRNHWRPVGSCCWKALIDLSEDCSLGFSASAPRQTSSDGDVWPVSCCWLPFMWSS